MNNWRQILSWEISQDVILTWLDTLAAAPYTYGGDLEDFDYDRASNTVLRGIERSLREVLGKNAKTITIEEPQFEDFDSSNVGHAGAYFNTKLRGPKEFLRMFWEYEVGDAEHFEENIESAV